MRSSARWGNCGTIIPRRHYWGRGIHHTANQRGEPPTGSISRVRRNSTSVDHRMISVSDTEQISPSQPAGLRPVQWLPKYLHKPRALKCQHAGKSDSMTSIIPSQQVPSIRCGVSQLRPSHGIRNRFSAWASFLNLTLGETYMQIPIPLLITVHDTSTTHARRRKVQNSLACRPAHLLVQRVDDDVSWSTPIRGSSQLPRVGISPGPGL